MMRSAARRNEVANYTLNVSITGSARTTMGDAPPPTPRETTPARCTQDRQVHLGTPPGGFERVLIFAGEKVRSDADAQVKTEKSGDLWVIEVNDYEHYRIPEAVITGG